MTDPFNQKLGPMSENLPHQLCAICPSVSLIASSFVMFHDAKSCRAMRPACLAVHWESRAGSAMMSFHKPLSRALAA